MTFRQMPDQWRAVAVQDCMEAIIDYRGKTPRKAANGVPLVTARIIKDGRIRTPEEFIPEADYAAWMRRGMPQSGDVLITTEAPLGEVAQLGDGRVALAQRVVALRGKTDQLDNTYLKFAVKGEFVQRQLRGRSTGTTVLGIRQSELRKVLIPVPPLSEQRAIAGILGALDDKIELNRRMNETLEGIARAIFKSWFVDFLPVRAKAEGRDPGLPVEIADLFPSSFVDSELGEIPEGWEPCDVGRHFRLTMGQSPLGSTYNDTGEGLPFYQGRADFGFRFPTRRVFCSAPTRVAEIGDTLVSVRAPVGDVNVANEKCAVGRGVAAIRHSGGSRSFTYCVMRNLSARFEHFEAEGTVFGAINKSDFERLPFVAPPLGVIAAFDRLVSPHDDKIELNERQGDALKCTRDTLLPKLISGELRVPDAERVVGRCV